MVRDGGAIAIGAYPLVHGPVPVLANHNYEDGRKCPPNIVKVVSRKRVEITRVVQLNDSCLSNDKIVVTVDQSNIGEKFHAKQSKDVHEEQEQQTEVADVFQTGHCLLKKILQFWPRFGQLKHSKEPQGAESIQSWTSVKVRDMRQSKVDKGNKNDSGVEQVVTVWFVVVLAKANKFQDHF